ncbi:unnamed protein product [Cyclocybe aegerita]|uniref:Uncharacterized protein n=1 Tax=Cyclocybe aegerita TaxID=1973307 RepID=A0A8S0XYT3_CYCAE|nr:unnamed protein product [Cyclocybe aegerita]
MLGVALRGTPKAQQTVVYKPPEGWRVTWPTSDANYPPTFDILMTAPNERRRFVTFRFSESSIRKSSVQRPSLPHSLDLKGIFNSIHALPQSTSTTTHHRKFETAQDNRLGHYGQEESLCTLSSPRRSLPEAIAMRVDSQGLGDWNVDQVVGAKEYEGRTVDDDDDGLVLSNDRSTQEVCPTFAVESVCDDVLNHFSGSHILKISM